MVAYAIDADFIGVAIEVIKSMENLLGRITESTNGRVEIIRVWCNGSIRASKSLGVGSIPTARAKMLN